MPSTRNRTIALLTASVTAVPVLALTGASGAAAATTTLRIDAGGPSIVTAGGDRWAADTGARGGTRIVSRAAIAGTGADNLYRTARVGMTGYRVRVGRAGTFRVTLKFAELQGRKAGQRVFSVDAEGHRIESGIDIARRVGRNHALSLTRSVKVSDGVLDLAFPATHGRATVSAIQVRRVAARTQTSLAQDSVAATGTGVSWPSGVFMPSGKPSAYTAFGAWRGHKVDVAVTWEARASWSDIVNPSWLYDTWAGTSMTKVIGVAPLPEGDSSATMAGCAAGKYDAKWRQFATNIKAAGMDGQSIIRLGWEFNGDWYKWSAKNPAQFAECWRQIVGTAEKVAPKLRWDWTVNRGQAAGLPDARKAWPGNAYVDVVGVDSYDMWPSVKSTTSWGDQLNGKYGLNFWLSWAVAHHKKLSVPEWGVYPGPGSSGGAGGDNPFYVQEMHGFFAKNAKHIAYESYFNESASYYGGSIYGPVQNPKASKAYRAMF